MTHALNRSATGTGSFDSTALEWCKGDFIAQDLLVNQIECG